MQYQQYEDSQRELRQQGHYRQASHGQVIYFGQLAEVNLAAHRHAAQQMLRKAAIIMGRSQETLENASRELRQEGHCDAFCNHSIQGRTEGLLN